MCFKYLIKFLFFSTFNSVILFRITITKLGPSSGSSSDTIIRKTLRGSRKGKTKSKSFCIAKADKKFKGLKK